MKKRKKKNEEEGAASSANPDEPVVDAEGEAESPESPSAPVPTEGPVNFSAEPEPEPEHEEEPPRREERRGRPPGSKGKKRKAARDEAKPGDLSKLLLSCHQMLSALTGITELLLTQEEADKMGEAVADVEALYADSAFISPEIQAWANLGLTSVMIYWPRYVTIKKRMEKEAREEQSIDDVTPIRQTVQTGVNMTREGTGSVS